MKTDITKFLFRFKSDIQKKLAESQAKQQEMSLNAWMQKAVELSLHGSSGDTVAKPQSADLVSALKIPGLMRASDIGTEKQESALAEQRSVPEAPEFADEPARKLCSYSEWSGELGEMMRCGLPEHSPKQRHGAWRKA